MDLIGGPGTPCAAAERELEPNDGRARSARPTRGELRPGSRAWLRGLPLLRQFETGSAGASMCTIL